MRMTPQSFNDMDKVLRSNPAEEMAKQALQSIGTMQKKIEIPPMPEPFTQTDMPTSEASILLAVNGEQFGPYTRTQVRDMIAHGDITTETLMWTSGMLEWMPLSKVPGII